MSTGDERRCYKRLPTELVAHFRKSTHEGIVKNLSLGGVFLETHHKHAPGDLVEFDIILPKKRGSDPVRIAVEGVVKWYNKEHPSGIGVEIKRITVSDRDKLTDYIREISHPIGQKRSSSTSAIWKKKR